jgi:ATP-dependent Clp protease ATP-binding subunit ClpC
MSLWQRFTSQARKVIYRAQEEAQKYGEGYVATEHLLLGLVLEPGHGGATVLQNLGVSLNRVRAEVEKHLPRGDARPSQEMTLTPRAKRVCDLAGEEAHRTGVEHIDSEHLLLGIVLEGDGLAGRVLAKLGVRIAAVRHEVFLLRGLEPNTTAPVDEEPSPVLALPAKPDTGYFAGVYVQLGELLAAKPELMDHPATLNAELQVQIPNHARERRLLVHALELRIPHEIAADASPIKRADMVLWSGRLQREIGITPAAALFAVQTWAAALGKTVE